MTTRFECPKHGAMKPGQILHNGHTYTCSSCGQGLRANSEDTRDAEIVRLRAENAALAAHVERLDTLAIRYLESSQELVELLRASGGVLKRTPQTSLTQLKAAWQAEAVEAVNEIDDEYDRMDYAKALRRQAEATP